MRLLMLTPIYPPRIGGPSTNCEHLCRVLAERGHRVTVGTFTESGTPGTAERDGVTVASIRWRYGLGPLDKVARWFLFPVEVRRLLRSCSPEVVVCHSVSLPMMIAGWMCRRRGIPSVIKFAGDWVFETLNTRQMVEGESFEAAYQSSWVTRLMLAVERWGLRQFTVLWATSGFREQNLRYLVPNGEIWLQNNCLDLRRLRAERRPASDGRVEIVSANRFVPHKRLETMLRAMGSLPSEVKARTHLTLVGGGDPTYVAKVHQLAKDLELGALVTFTGILQEPEVNACLASGDIYLATSAEEGFPNVMIQALAAGLPVVATAVGGVPELVRHGREGLLTPVDDVAGLAEALTQLVSNDELRRTMSDAARLRAETFDLATQGSNYEALYRRLAERYSKSLRDS